ncbi:MAG: Hsp70 family protein, partial [Victivallales bacterium]|nr:Hsp70 family protein [Victivallales bacterium]
GETAAETLLPSFCYLPGVHDLPENALSLPWDRSPKLAVGHFAREQGARIPERLIGSAKSWLAHAGVERTKPILPWGGELGDQMLSPVDASAQYLDHLKHAWDQRFAKIKDEDGTPCLLHNQQVVLTVPASFDETARELTVQAARKAGLSKLTLIEEPLAAFYAWLAANQNDWKQKVSVGDVVLVVDIGGGTTDLTIVEIEDDYTLRRKAVGEHLLLGGDNMDMTLAHIAETSWKTKLPQRQWSRLCQECRRAKEKLLSEDAPETMQVAVAGEGSSIFASLKTSDFKREEIQSAILDGFLPFVEIDSPPPERRRGIQSMGLPYAADAAVTKHILSFLKFAGKTLHNPAPIALPNKILFNGGALIPPILRQRIRDVVANWNGGAIPDELESADFSLAVSQGAAYYGLARRGEAVRVKGGIANAYFLEVAAQDGKRLLCVMPRDTDEGVVRQLPDTFLLQANTPVSFPLHASATRLEDKLGDVVEDSDDITPLPPLQTILRFGRKTDKTDLKVTLSSQLNEIGTLDVWCETVDKSHRFPLSFVLRGTAQNDAGGPLREDIIDEAHAVKALSFIEEAFAQDAQSLNASFMTKLEEILDAPRGEWGAPILRRMADLLLQHTEWRTATPAHEARWLNLTGFALRPGTGRAGRGAPLRFRDHLGHRGRVSGHRDLPVLRRQGPQVRRRGRGDLPEAGPLDGALALRVGGRALQPHHDAQLRPPQRPERTGHAHAQPSGTRAMERHGHPGRRPGAGGPGPARLLRVRGKPLVNRAGRVPVPRRKQDDPGPFIHRYEWPRSVFHIFVRKTVSISDELWRAGISKAPCITKILLQILSVTTDRNAGGFFI